MSDDGMAAVTASRRVKPPAPWVARTFWAERAPSDVVTAFGIAALPDGYAYRLVTAATITVGVVGRGASVRGSPQDMILDLLFWERKSRAPARFPREA